MRRFFCAPLALSLFLGFAALPARASDKSDIEATAQQMAQAFNTGNRKAWISLGAPTNQTVVDDFGLHYWNGPTALGSWFSAFYAVAKSAGYTDISITIAPAKYVEVDGKRAWGTFPTSYSYNDKGTVVHESGVLVFAFQKQSAGWRVLSMTWGRLA